MKLDEHPTVIQYRESRPVPLPADFRLDHDLVIDVCKRCGADDAGLVEIDRPALSDQKRDILAVFPGTRTLVSLVVRLNPENVRCLNRAVSDTEFLDANHETNRVARKAAAALTEMGVRALTPAAGFPMDMRRWPGKMWDVSHKPVAVAAGMGVMGLNRLLLHPIFGGFVILGTILLDREADGYDRPLDYNPCLDCKLCAAACPVGAVKADGSFHFANCMTHNYRDRLGGFQNWAENLIISRTVKDYRRRVTDRETVSMWQSLSYGICNKSSYCMAVCPAGRDNVGPYLEDRKVYLARVVKPLQEFSEPIYVVAGSDAEEHVRKHFPNKTAKRASNGLRPGSAAGFLQSMGLLFQPGQAKGLDATYHFIFTGAEECSGTVVIQNEKLTVLPGLEGKADLSLTADAKTWIGFLAKEKSLPWALATRKTKIKGSPRLMGAFAKCFPS